MANTERVGAGLRAGRRTASGILREFESFLLRGNVVDLAVGVVIGVAFGDFINALLSFVIVAAVIFFFVILPMNRLMALTRRGRQPDAPTTRECPECLSKVPLGARRCAFCTSPLPAEQTQTAEPA